MNDEEVFEKLILDKDVYTLVKVLFDGFKLTPKQCEIVRAVAFGEHRRIVINCMTRYGKTKCMSYAVCLYILLNENKKILQIAPIKTQADILRNYISEAISICPIMSDLLDRNLEATNLKKEVSKRRLTFKNGCELITLSAEGTGDRLMGEGGDLIIKDEDCLIKLEVYRSKISRMLGDSPDSIMVSIGNPWHRNNQMWNHWTDPDYHKIQVGYEDALREGRISPEFLEEQRRDLTPIEFTVLYESKFPEEADNAIFKWEHIQNCLDLDIRMKDPEFKISCDPADKGKDWTVIMVAAVKQDHYKIVEIYSEAKSENTSIAGRIEKYRGQYSAGAINIDYGMGVGVISMCKENSPNYVEVNSCMFGSSPFDKRRFANKKAEAYFRLAKLFEERKISIPNNKKLIDELMAITWDFTGASKIKIIDPDKSPDFADALVIMTWDIGELDNYGIA